MKLLSRQKLFSALTAILAVVFGRFECWVDVNMETETTNNIRRPAVYLFEKVHSSSFEAALLSGPASFMGSFRETVSSLKLGTVEL